MQVALIVFATAFYLFSFFPSPISVTNQLLLTAEQPCDLTKSIDDYVESGNDFVNKAIYFLAIESYSCAIQIDPKRMEFYLFRAGALTEVGQFERAIDDIKRVLASEPNNDLPHALLSWIYFEQAQYSDALTEVNNTLKINNTQFFSYVIRGRIYIKLNNEVKAIESFNEYIRLQKFPAIEAHGYAEIGFAYEHFGNAVLAQTYLKQAVELKPDIGTLYLATAQGYRRRSNFEMALEYLNKAVRLTPDLVAAYYERAAVLLELKFSSRASSDCEKIIQLQPQKPEGYVCQGIFHSEVKDYRASLDDFNQAIEMDEHFISAYGGRAGIEMILQNYDAALADINVAITAEPLISFNYQIRAVIYTSLNKIDEAIADYETYLHLQGGAEINPDIVEKIRQIKAKITNI